LDNYGSLQSSVKLADVTGDGAMDVVAVTVWDYPMEKLTILRNTGDGHFVMHGEYGDVTNRSFSVSDMDGDSDLDILAGCDLRVFWNDGDGYFTPQLIDEYFTIGINTGDMDEDGDLDIVGFKRVDYSIDSLVIVLNKGNNQFVRSFAGEVRNTALEYDKIDPYMNFLSDLNGDSHLDVPTTTSGGTSPDSILVYPGDGEGGLHPPIVTIVENPGCCGYLRGVLDLNGDGNVDLLMASRDPETYPFVAYNEGGGMFSVSVVPDLPAHDRRFSIDCADLDGNGGMDIAVFLQTFGASAEDSIEILFAEVLEVTCGNVNGRGEDDIDIDDVVYLIQYIFSGGPPPDPIEAGDVDCSGGSMPVDIDDIVYLIEYIFVSGNAPCDIDGDGVPDC
jgi:hypothetical protein